MATIDQTCIYRASRPITAVGRGAGSSVDPGLERHLRVLPQPTPRQGPTLEDLLSGAWEDLIAHRTAACPICEGAMAPRYGSGPSAVGGRCEGCGTELT